MSKAHLFLDQSTMELVATLDSEEVHRMCLLRYDRLTQEAAKGWRYPTDHQLLAAAEQELREEGL